VHIVRTERVRGSLLEVWLIPAAAPSPDAPVLVETPNGRQRPGRCCCWQHDLRRPQLVKVTIAMDGAMDGEHA
jgi:hypothetical protein